MEDLVLIKVHYVVARYFGAETLDRVMDVEIPLSIFNSIDFRLILVNYLIQTANFFGYDTVIDVGYEVVSEDYDESSEKE